MLWPAAALAGLLLTFVIVYGSIVQGRIGNTRDASSGMSVRDPGR
jgi:hypothetical protein